MVLDTILSFVVGLLVGALAIHLAATVVVGKSTYQKALVTAAIASVAWALTSLFLGWLPLVGPLIVLVVYVGVINLQYPGGWLKAAGIGLVAWLASLLVLAILSFVGLGVEVVGVPGV
ncbi:hypothetical protein [Haloarcula marina]|uniref:hypothetical protein n=1 Tax=Haloarcula marina TaxID=2961574 RepID=UPI0020B7FE10|nr:hypothetical protein [Halomicroarcula marina]